MMMCQKCGSNLAYIMSDSYNVWCPVCYKMDEVPKDFLANDVEQIVNLRK